MAECCDSQPSLIEYARFHGLAENHLNQDIHECLPKDILPHGDDAELPEFRVPHVGRLPPEPKLRLNSKTASLLASSLRPPPAPALDWSNSFPHQAQLKSLKLEQPVLRTDHGSDMKKIHCRKARSPIPIDLIPLEVDEESGGSLSSLLEIASLAKQWDKKLKREKLQTTRHVLKSLQEILRPVYTPQVYETILAEELTLRKRPTQQHFCPRLLSSQYDEELHVPPSPGLCMANLPDSDYEQMPESKKDGANQSRVQTEDVAAAAVGPTEQLVQLAEHGQTPDEIIVSDEDEKHPTRRRQHAEPLDFDPTGVGPLNRPEATREIGARSVDFASTLGTILPEKMHDEKPSSEDTGQPLRDDCIGQFAHHAAQSVKRDLAERQMEPENLNRPLEVPMLDEVKPAAPDMTISSQQFLQKMIERHLKHTVRSFSKGAEGAVEERPSPSGLSKPFIEESIKQPAQYKEWISEPAFAIRTEDLLWGPDELRILSVDGESDEEELEVDSSLQDQPVQETQLPKKRLIEDLPGTFCDRQTHHLSIPEPGLGTSAFGCLAGFMHTRNAYKKRRLDADGTPTEATQATEATETKDGSAVGSGKKSMCSIQVPASPTDTPFINFPTLSAPHVPNVTSSRTIVVSSGLLKSHWRLTQTLETHPDPPLVIIYRDLGIGDGTDATPDIIITPTIAALLTSLQATTQRSLPGQGSTRSHIFDHIHDVSRLYEKLFVLTALPPADTSPLQSTVTCAQISNLYAFCASLSQTDAVVQPILIPSPPSIKPTLPITSGSKPAEPLYQWTYALICKHALDPTCTPNLNITLLAEETLWELFLRKAGMNPFAAQVVLGMLKKSKETPQRQRQTQEQRQGKRADLWGLRAFVQMRRDERLGMFADVVGRGPIERVSDVLDAPWAGRSAPRRHR